MAWVPSCARPASVAPPRSCSGTSTTSRQWEQIDAAEKERQAPFLVYRESDAVTRAMRDYLSDDVGEVLVDDDAAFKKAQEYMQRFMPADAQRKLKHYVDDIPLFTRFQIE